MEALGDTADGKSAWSYPDEMYDMNFEDFPESKPVFDEPAVKAVLAETGLPWAPGTTIRELGDGLEDIARQHYWNEFHPPDADRENDVIQFDAIADASVAPSRLRNRLIAIEQSSLPGTGRSSWSEFRILGPESCGVPSSPISGRRANRRVPDSNWPTRFECKRLPGPKK